MSKRTHDYGISMSKSGICLQHILFVVSLSYEACDGSCNCSHDETLNECVDLYRQNGWYNLGNIINNVIRFGSEKWMMPTSELKQVYKFLMDNLKKVYEEKGLAAQGLLINIALAKKYLTEGPKPEGAKAPRIESAVAVV
jgi:hypothetical protein